MTEQEHAFGGPWTEEKLNILTNYLPAFNRVLKGKLRTIYIDAFAGNGYCTIRTSDGGTKTISGSASLSLQTTPSFDEYHFFEQRKDFAQQLRNLANQYPNHNVKIYQRNANHALPQLLTGSWRGRRAVLFLDPYGLDVDWAMVRKIAETRAIDVWFLVSISGVYRQAANQYGAIDDKKAAALDRFLGTGEWRDTFYQMPDLFSNQGQKRTADWKDIAHYIKHQLSSVFAGGVLDPVILRNGNVPLYGLYFALANPSEKAMDVAKRIAGHIMNKHR